MQVIADLQLHSKYARAVSPQMVIPHIWDWAKRKGIGLVATGDWTHPLWMREIKANLEEAGNGLLKLRTKDLEFRTDDGPYFLLETEVSCIYSQGGKLRRIHTLIWSPSIVTSEKINKELTARGANLMSDGRPIMGLTSMQIAEVVLTIDPKCLIIPAHIWTPWFSLYGSESGFDSIDECFGRYAKYIYAVETGLSSDPAMNWRIKELDNRSIVSFSDAHSGPKLGREATVFELEELSFENIRKAIIAPSLDSQVSSIKYPVSSMKEENNENIPNTKYNLQNTNLIAFTIEFHPEEGKYHYTGHRNCGVKQSPLDTRQKGTICPVCGRKLTIGVMHRVDQLAGRSEEELRIKKQELSGTQIQAVFTDSFPNRPPYVMMVPLQEIIAEALGSKVANLNVQNEYKKLTDNFSGEFKVLLDVPVESISKISGPRLAEAIEKVRNGNIEVDPGYDGVFGVVKIWTEEKDKKQDNTKEQMSLF